MISTHGSASAKVILFGEHAVVYGQPAVAIPIQDVRASAAVSIDASISAPIIEAKDLKIEIENQTRQIKEQNTELARLIKEKTDLFVNFNHETKTP